MRPNSLIKPFRPVLERKSNIKKIVLGAGVAKVTRVPWAKVGFTFIWACTVVQAAGLPMADRATFPGDIQVRGQRAHPGSIQRLNSQKIHPQKITVRAPP